MKDKLILSPAKQKKESRRNDTVTETMDGPEGLIVSLVPTEETFQILNAAATATSNGLVDRFIYLLDSRYWPIKNDSYLNLLKNLVLNIEKIVLNKMGSEELKQLIETYVTPHENYLSILFPSDFDWVNYFTFKKTTNALPEAIDVGKVLSYVTGIEAQISKQIEESEVLFNQYWGKLFQDLKGCMPDERRVLFCPQEWIDNLKTTDYVEKLKQAIKERKLSPHEGSFTLLAIKYLQTEMVKFLLRCGVDPRRMRNYEVSDSEDSGMDELLRLLFLPNYCKESEEATSSTATTSQVLRRYAQTQKVIGKLEWQRVEVTSAETHKTTALGTLHHRREQITKDTITFSPNDPDSLIKLDAIRNAFVSAIGEGNVPALLPNEPSQQQFLSLACALARVGTKYITAKSNTASERDQLYAAELLQTTAGTTSLAIIQGTAPEPTKIEKVIDDAVIAAVGSRGYGTPGQWGINNSDFARDVNAELGPLGKEVRRSFWTGEISIASIPPTLSGKAFSS